MKTLKKMGLIFSGIVLIVVLLIFYLLFKRETKEWTENITVAPNTEVSVNLMSSQRGYFGGHGLGWGGGHQKNAIDFEYAGISYKHKTPYIPISIKYENQSFYIIYYDRETDINNTTFKFFKSVENGDFEEINTSDFPKHLAIQNRWFGGLNSNEEDLEGLDSEKLVGTMTVDIWYMIEGKKTLDGYDATEIDFIKNYKEKYIK
ncbi:hypothetical protein GCM10009430_28000 [Aquimarina litoralis]|uniref:Uncharacterized protein n=1 Tax=Aquimarina litoralis TaxID=584605 RepID=A0ABN1IYF6_9FLAO